MNRRMVGGIFAAAALALSFSASAIDRDFTLANGSGHTIREMYVSPTSQTTWGADVLGVDVLEDGQQATIHFTPSNYRGQCQFDIKLVGTGGEQWVISPINLCTVSRVAVSMRGASMVFQAQ